MYVIFSATLPVTTTTEIMTTQPPCPPSFTKLTTGCFLLDPSSSLDWDDAKASCAARGPDIGLAEFGSVAVSTSNNIIL